jgi:hypothetical protein
VRYIGTDGLEYEDHECDDDPYYDEPKPKRERYVIAFYEVDMQYGGPEEGGWWYSTGRLVRVFKVVKDREEATRICRRANDLLHHLQRNKREVSSVIYDGGRYAAEVHEHNAPEYYPTERPYYC